MQKFKWNILFLMTVIFLSVYGLVGCSSDDIIIETVGEASQKESASGKDIKDRTLSQNKDQSQNEDQSQKEEMSGDGSEDKPLEKENVSEAESSEKDDSTDRTSEQSDKPGTIFVYVCGAVQSEGVYELSPDSRKKDALEKAGGYSESAARGYVNLAEKVSDGERIYIPDEQEVSKGAIMIGPNSGTGDNLGESMGENSGIDSETKSGKVNINTADKQTLMTLSGIGQSKAADIIAYRDLKGGFGSVEELKKVSGIGEATFNKLKDSITVD